MEALQLAVLLLPDEHREALQTLLYFLHDVAKHSATNSVNNFFSYFFNYPFTFPANLFSLLYAASFHFHFCVLNTLFGKFGWGENSSAII